MSEGVTPPPPILIGGYKTAKDRQEGVITWGVDSLVVSSYVDFSWSWCDISEKFENMLNKCRGLGAPFIVLDEDSFGDSVLICTTSIRRYRFHLQLPFAHVFIQNLPSFVGDTPNVRIDFLAKALWLGDWGQIWEDTQRFIRELGGRQDKYFVSKAALTVDRVFKEEITLEDVTGNFRTHIPQMQPFLNNGKLETVYVGKKNSPCAFKLYQKILEIGKREKEGKPDPFYMLELWGKEALRKLVYRFEFTFDRDYLKDRQVNTVDDLIKKRADLWQEATSDRLEWVQSNRKEKYKCALRSEWLDLQGAFGETWVMPLERKLSRPASVEFYRARLLQALGRYVGVLQLENDLYKEIDIALSETLNDLVNNAEAMQEIGAVAELKRKAVEKRVLELTGEFTRKNDFAMGADDDWENW